MDCKVIIYANFNSSFDTLFVLIFLLEILSINLYAFLAFYAL